MANKSQLYFIGAPAGASSVLDYFTATDAVHPVGSAAVAVGRNNHPLVAYPAAQLGYVDFPGVLPPSGIVKLALYWAATVAVGDVLWDVAWERDNATFVFPQVNLDFDAFALSKVALSPAPVISGLLREAVINFTPAEMGGILPGEPYRIRVKRNAGVAPDTMAGDAQLFRVVLGSA
jgi:hypothetical protein